MLCITAEFAEAVDGPPGPAPGAMPQLQIEEQPTYHGGYAVNPHLQAQQMASDSQQEMMMKTLEVIMKRITAIEEYVTQMQRTMHHKEGLGQDVQDLVHDVGSALGCSPGTPSEVSSQVSSHLQPPIESTGPSPYRFELENVRELWYTERAYPPFLIRIIDNETNQLVSDTTGWIVNIHLLDGFGRMVDDKLGDEKSRKVMLVDGCGEASGLKFLKVSSKNGNKFNLQLELISPPEIAPLVPRLQTPDLKILSCRLYTCRKGSFSKLSGQDSVLRMPGIGKQYGQRLEKHNVHTIHQLSEISTAPGDPNRLQLLDEIRKEKGAMTDIKLVESIRNALAIVQGEFSGSPSAQQHPFTATTAAPAVKRPLDVPAPPTTSEGFSTPQSDPTKRQRLSERTQSQNEIAPDLYNSFDLLASQLSNSRSDSLANCEFDFTGDIGVCGDSFIDTSMVTDEYDTGAAMLFPANASTYRAVSMESATSPRVGPQSSPATAANTAPGQQKVRIKFPLHMAIARRNLEMCKQVVAALRQQGMPVDSFLAGRFTPLMLACTLGYVDIVEYLLELPETSAGACKPDGWTALHLCASHDSRSCAEALVSHMLSNQLCPVTAGGWTPVMIAVLRGDVEMARVLVRRISPSTHSQAINGLTLGHLACLSGSIDCVKFVHEWDMSSFSDSSDTSSPSLMHCAAYAGQVEVLHWLFRNNLATLRPWGEGYTPLHVAASQGNVDAVRVLLAHDTSTINARTNKGWTPLSLVAMSESETGAECVRLLLAAGADDSVSAVPASIVSVACSNLDVLTAMMKDKPEVRLNTMVGGKLVDPAEVGRSVGLQPDVDEK